MQVKRFFAADMRQAMKLVRDELGAEAAIIGNRRVAGGIELTAALDYPVPPATAVRPNAALEAELRKTQSIIAQARSKLALPEGLTATDDARLTGDKLTDLLGGAGRREPQLADVAAARHEVPAARAAVPAPLVPAPVDTPVLDRMRLELHGRPELPGIQLGPLAWRAVQQRPPHQAHLWRRLRRMGLPAGISRELLDRVNGIVRPEQAWRTILAHLARMVRVQPDDPLEQGGVIAMVGPAGAGKTTTLSKLAARYVLQHGARDIALVTMDNFRMGAQEQLKTLGRILDVPVIAVGADQSVAQALAPLGRKKVVLVDTAGLPVSDPGFRLQMEALAARDLQARNYLVLSATSQAQVLKSAWHSHMQCGLAGCVITKADEAGTLGEVLGIVASQRLNVAWLADGPRIPDDLHRPKAHQLVSRAVSLQLDEEPGSDVMAHVLAGLYDRNARQAC